MAEARKLIGLGPAEPPSYAEKLAGKYVDHQSPVSLREHARVLKDAGRGDEAIQYLDKALQLDDYDALAHYMRGHTLHWFGKSAEAIPNLERAAALYAQQGPAQFYQEAKARWFLGLLLFELGDKEAARRSLQQAADLHRSYGRAFDANAVLKDIDALTRGTLRMLRALG
jgi:tetratricopeptide (TPR) repeat protein